MEAIRKSYVQVIALYQAVMPVRRRTLLVAAIAIAAALAVATFVGPSKSYVPVLNGKELNDAEMDRAKRKLVRAGLSDYRSEGVRLVALERQIDLYNTALREIDPSETNASQGSEPFGALSGLLTTPRQRDHLQELALRKELEGVICKIPAIQDATVIWARGKAKGGLRRESNVTASVNVLPHDGIELSLVLRDSLRAAVRHMVPDLKPTDVVILDQSTGKTYSFTHDQAQNYQLSTLTNQLTQGYRSKIEQALAYIPHVLVTVNVELNEQNKLPVGSSVSANEAPVAATTSQRETVSTKAVRVAVAIPEDYFAAVSAKRRSNGPGHEQHPSASRNGVDSVKREEMKKAKATVAKLVLSNPSADAITVNSYVRIDRPKQPSEAESSMSSSGGWEIWMFVIGLLGLTSSAVWIINKRALGRLQPETTDEIPSDPRHTDDQIDEEGDEVEFERGFLDVDEMPQMLTKLGNNESSLENVRRKVNSVPFAFLEDVNHDHLLDFIVCEQPQTIALIISHLPSDLANRLIDGLPFEKRAEVLRRIENMEPIVPEVFDGIARNLKGRIFSSLSEPVNEVDRQAAAPGAKGTTDKHSAPSVIAQPFSDRLVLPMQSSDPRATFDDLVKLRSSSLKSLLQQIDASRWAVALKGASEETKQKLFDNLATREKEKLKEEINHLGPVKIGDIKEMQQLVIGAASRLEMVV